MIDMKVAILTFPRDLQPRQRRSLEALPPPLPLARTPLPDEPFGPLLGKSSYRFSSWNDLRVRHLKDVFLSKGTRLPLVSPENLDSGRSPISCMPAGRH